MNSLYRCRCAVGYRPYGSSRLILFPERQVVSANVNLRWNANSVAMNADTTTTLSQFVNSLTGSTANVTLSDPYMTGVAWAALFDSAAAYTSSAHAAANNILLPACGENEDPSSGKCRNFIDIDDPNTSGTTFGTFAHFMVQYYYTVAGTKFGLTTYFRLQGFSIDHGGSYPRVSLQGIDPQTMIFNQNLVNYQMEEGKTLEENLEDIIKEYDYKVTFCTDPTQPDTKEYIMPRNFKEKSVTAGEIIQKYLRSVKGNYLSMPTKEFAKKISICTRSNINQGCSVFYLGKGLYESYQITGSVPRTLANLNTEFGFNQGLKYKFDSDNLEEKEYEINNILPRKRAEKLRKAKTNLTKFPQQFEVYQKRFVQDLSTSGYVWESSGPSVKTERKTRINMFGLNVNGTEPVALLDGKVRTAAKDGKGLVLVDTNYFIRFCEKGNKPPCQNRLIVQETRNLTVDASIEVGKKLEINQKLGTSTADSPEHTRFYLAGTDVVTLSPEIVWKYAVPTEDLSDEEEKNAGLERSGSSPSGPETTNPGSTGVIGKVGNTGRSTGPHLHVEAVPRESVTESELDALVDKYVEFSGKSRGRGFAGHGYNGIDYPAPEGAPLSLINGSTLRQIETTGCVNGDEGCGGGFGNSVLIDTPEGKILRLAHLAPGSITGTPSRTGSGDRFASGVRGGPAVMGARITTEFKGVPRALRIIPGRTILSLVTRYDEWIEKGKPSDIDPGIWIAGRFSKWFVEGALYNWSQGDLRVQINGITDWGVQVTKADTPSFEQYLEVSGFEKTNDYYGYIRSLGDLCWKLESGKTSCEERCEDAERLRRFLRSGSEDPGATVDSNFPASQCRYTGDYLKASTSTMNEVMAALKSVGITNPYAYAGVLGNFQIESGIRANRHNLRDPGRGCTRTNTPGYGIAQWCYSRQDNIRAFCGDSSTLDCELRFMIKEIKEGKDVDQDVITAMNNAKSAEEAASLWNQYYERGDGKVPERSAEAGKIYPGLKCAPISS